MDKLFLESKELDTPVEVKGWTLRELIEFVKKSLKARQARATPAGYKLLVKSLYEWVKEEAKAGYKPTAVDLELWIGEQLRADRFKL